MSHDVRWKQRFQNLDKVVALLNDALKGGPDKLSDLEKEGVIQRFECAFELSWKTLKDYLEASGVVISPITLRQVLKQAFSAKLIQDGELWIKMLDHRNLLSHTYDSTVFRDAVNAIARDYLPLINALQQFFQQESSQ